MIVPTGNKYIVEVKQVHEIGTPWIVSVHQKSFLFKRPVSSDWFLDETQAKTFAKTLATQLHDERFVTTLKDRKPGWTLNRAAH